MAVVCNRYIGERLNYYQGERESLYTSLPALIRSSRSSLSARCLHRSCLFLPRLLAPRDVSCLPGPLVSPTAILISPYPIPLPPVSLHAKIGRIAPLCPRLCNAKAIFLILPHRLHK